MTLYFINFATFIICFCTFYSIIPSTEAKTTYLSPNNSRANVTASSDVVISCPKLIKDGKPKQLYWEKDTTRVGSLADGVMNFKPRYRRNRQNLSRDEYDLVMTGVNPDDEGVYQCRQFDSNGRKYFSKTMRLHVPQASREPKIYQITSKPRRLVDLTNMITIAVGEKLVLTCEANGGHPGAAIRWRIRGRFVDPDNGGAFTTSGISGTVNTRQTLIGPNRPPRFRNTKSVLTTYVKSAHNSSLVTCFAVNPGAPNKATIAKILVMSSGANGSFRIDILAINMFAVFVLMFSNQ